MLDSNTALCHAVNSQLVLVLRAVSWVLLHFKP